MSRPIILRPKHRDKNARMKARKRGATIVEVFTLWDVAQRDGWTCGICGHQVLRSAADGWIASLDHITPLIRGGEHTLDNVQLSHLRCNHAKDDMLMGEVPMSLVLTLQDEAHKRGLDCSFRVSCVAC